MHPLPFTYQLWAMSLPEGTTLPSARPAVPAFGTGLGSALTRPATGLIGGGARQRIGGSALRMVAGTPTGTLNSKDTWAGLVSAYTSGADLQRHQSHSHTLTRRRVPLTV